MKTREIPDRRSISSTALSLFVTALFAVILNAKIWEIYLYNIPVNNFMDFVEVSCFFLFIFFLLFALLSVFNVQKIQKTVYIIFLLISVPSMYFEMSFGVLFDDSMVQNVLETDFHEAKDLLTTSFFLIFLIFGVLPSWLIYKTKVSYQKLWKRVSLNISYFIGSLVISVAFVYPFYGDFSSFVRNNNKQLSRSLLPSAPIYAFYKNIMKNRGDQNIVKEIFDKNARISQQKFQHLDKPLVFVIIIGETARASSFARNESKFNADIGNLVETKNLVYFNNFTSCGTNTALSLPCMFSMFPKDDYKRKYNKKYENVAEIIQRVGYDVMWRENDGGCKGVCIKLQNKPINQKNSAKYYHENEFYDQALVENLADQIKQKATNQVIFLHQTGSHGPAYYKRVPERFKKYLPACESENFRDCKDEEIINAYDNTVLYTKFVIRNAIVELKTISDSYNSVLLYVSDHGESTGEGGYYLHGIPYFMAPEDQTHIPALIWMSDGYISEKRINLDCLKSKEGNHFSHDNFSHTLLGILEIENTVYNPELNLLNGCTG